MKPHSVLLRNDCVLPNPLNPLQTAFGEQWTIVEEIPANVFDTMIRQAGWHFIWICGSISRRGYGRTHSGAVEQALNRVLSATSRQTNAAEFESVHVVKRFGFHVAKVTVNGRRIQQHSVLEAGLKAQAKALRAI